MVVDLGSHRGEFALELVQRFGAQCHAVEASPLLFEQISGEAGLHRHLMAMAGHDGEVAFFLSSLPESSSIHEGVPDSHPINARAVTLDTFLAQAGIQFVDLLKVDIEGAEQALMSSAADTTLLRVGQISIEFHDFLGFSAPEEVRAIRRRLRRLGFFELRVSRDNSNCLFVQRRVVGLTLPQLMVARYVERNLKGLRRVLRRRRATT